MLRHTLTVTTGDRKARCDDRAEVVAHPAGAVVLLADGATGVGDGHIAARLLVERLRARVAPDAAAAPGRLERELSGVDVAIATSGHDCDTTGILAVVKDGLVHGASVGDSEAWLFRRDGTRRQLTAGQNRKPRLGSGAARPVAWAPVPLADHLLLLGSDGLFAWLDMTAIDALVAATPAPVLPQALRAAVLAANGGRLPDDFSAIALWDENPAAARPAGV